MQLNISWAEPLDRGASQGVFTPVTGYDLVISMGPKLSGVPSANGMAVGASENITVIPLPDSGKKRESAVVENLVKGMSYFVYVRARNTAFDFKGNGPWSDGTNHSDVYVFVCVLLASLEYALLNCYMNCYMNYALLICCMICITGALTKCADYLRRPSVCGVTKITILDTPTAPLNFKMRSIGLSKIRASWDRPADTGTGTSAYPLLRYEFEYFKMGAEVDSLTTVVRFDENVTYTTPEVALGEIYKGRLRAANDAATSVWTEYSQALVLLLPDAPGEVVAINDGIYLILTPIPVYMCVYVTVYKCVYFFYEPTS